ncbi:response regulator [Consotaella salsifontis]|uniref:Two-component system, NarL family, response regulator DesR n=1 Tax=Consotaella salsifontis TaxID=1365950 RepID=A0A1T4QXI3_9HYPH|nr:response regulator [Consotaella salsifontis]SKA08171.1 two-component system, NarL family, response regulator DesR [Consotaella salsifontis]
MSDAKRIAIVDDDVIISSFFMDVCELHGGEVVGMAHEADEAIDLITREKPDFVLMDVRLGGKRDGIDVAQAIQAIHEMLPETRIIFITGSSEPELLKRIGSAPVFQLMIKPVMCADLVKALGLGEMQRYRMSA